MRNVSKNGKRLARNIMLSHHVGRYICTYVGMQYMLDGRWRQNGTEGEKRESEREGERV